MFFCLGSKSNGFAFGSSFTLSHPGMLKVTSVVFGIALYAENILRALTSVQIFLTEAPRNPGLETHGLCISDFLVDCGDLGSKTGF